MSHVTYEWVMSHMNESCHIWMSHITYEWVMSHMNKSCHIWIRHDTYEWVMSHTNESCHIWMSHVTYEWVLWHMNESFHRWMIHITSKTQITHHDIAQLMIANKASQSLARLYVTWLIYVNSWHIYIWWGWFMSDMTHFWMTSRIWHDYERVPWLIHMCEMTHSHVWHDAFMSISDISTYDGADSWVTWPIFEWHHAFVYVTWLWTCAMTHSHVWHDEFMCVT